MAGTKSKSMTEGSEWKLILFFTLPLMAGNLLQQLYNTVDGIIVGNAVSENALASVGTCSPLTMFFIAIAVGMSNGAGVLVSQYYGARQMNEMKRSISTALLLMALLGVCFSLLGIGVAKPMLQYVLGVQDYLLADAVLYFRIYAAGLLFQFVYNITAAILRSLGDSKATLYVLLVSSCANIVLDILAVVVLHWGVAGAALATIVSQMISAIVMLLYMVRVYPELRFSRTEFVFEREKCGLILKMGIPTALQQCVASMGHMAIQRAVNAFDITAGYTAAQRIETFIVIPIQSFFMGMATFTGQNLGAGKLNRIYRGLRRTILMGLVVCGVVIAVIFPLAPQLISLFGVEGASREICVQYLRFSIFAFLLFCIYFCINGVLQGSGDVTFIAFNTFSGLLMKVIFVYISAFLTPIGVASIWWGNLVSWLYSMVLSLLRYRFGPWRTKAVTQIRTGE